MGLSCEYAGGHSHADVVSKGSSNKGRAKKQTAQVWMSVPVVNGASAQRGADRWMSSTSEAGSGSGTPPSLASLDDKDTDTPTSPTDSVRLSDGVLAGLRLFSDLHLDLNLHMDMDLASAFPPQIHPNHSDHQFYHHHQNQLLPMHLLLPQTPSHFNKLHRLPQPDQVNFLDVLINSFDKNFDWCGADDANHWPSKILDHASLF
ncbi:hypothetical protein HK100_012359 [Physocladia obscura]|uniref:Uncharacterized protein n=1 Tax=Physocladia obscura TaxID=109957 RepID=A0AAD5SZW0_9FUNG|nr:hypothetical protein HK100_012359 [Physocladia obscura]